MANNEQLIADLGEAINLSNAAQQRFGENNDSFNRIIQAGLAQINATIRDIDALLGQITDKINSLKARIQELQNNGGPVPGDEITLLRQQLDAALKGQMDATTVMNKALETLRSNTVAMNRSIEVQDEPAMTKQLKTVTDSLQAIQLRLRGILNDNVESKPRLTSQEQRRAQLGEDSGEDSDDDDSHSMTYESIYPSRSSNKTKKGGTRKTKRTRKTKKKRKQKGGYKYNTKQHKSISDTSSGTGRGRGRGKGIYNKSKKRRIARS